jgi:hypothetical protein
MSLINNKKDPKKTDDQPDDGKNQTKSFTNTFATVLIALSGGLLLMLLIMAACYMCDKNAFANVKELFNILLPVIGTWMGTLLAFYFSKDNFAAASKQANELADKMNATDQTLQAFKVSDVMIKPADGSLLALDNEQKFKEMTLTELRAKMEETHSERLPILEKVTMKFIFLIYRTTIERFLVEYDDKSIKFTAVRVPDRTRENLTVQDMYDSDFKLFKDIQNIQYCFLPVNTTLDKVKAAMQDNSICQDVFITQTGSREESVLGWITNNLVIEKAELFKKAGK